MSKHRTCPSLCAGQHPGREHRPCDCVNAPEGSPTCQYCDWEDYTGPVDQTPTASLPILDAVTRTNFTSPCWACGETGSIKATASKGGDIRYFCHSEKKSCYNDYRGRYFDAPSTGQIGRIPRDPCSHPVGFKCDNCSRHAA